jgi:hypothetical protein
MHAAVVTGKEDRKSIESAFSYLIFPRPRLTDSRHEKKRSTPAVRFLGLGHQDTIHAPRRRDAWMCSGDPMND